MIEREVTKNPRKTKFFGGFIFSLPFDYRSGTAQESGIRNPESNERSEEERRDERYTEENEHEVL